MANLKLQNLYKMYDQGNGKKDGVYAVNNLNLEIEDGTFLGILGPSGCGKSTTLRMIAGLEEITKGEIAYRHVFEAIDKLGYDRYIGLEYMTENDPVPGLIEARETILI